MVLQRRLQYTLCKWTRSVQLPRMVVQGSPCCNADARWLAQIFEEARGHSRRACCSERAHEWLEATAETLTASNARGLSMPLVFPRRTIRAQRAAELMSIAQSMIIRQFLPYLGWKIGDEAGIRGVIQYYPRHCCPSSTLRRFGPETTTSSYVLQSSEPALS